MGMYLFLCIAKSISKRGQGQSSRFVFCDWAISSCPSSTTTTSASSTNTTTAYSYSFFFSISSFFFTLALFLYCCAGKASSIQGRCFHGGTGRPPPAI